MRDVYLIKEFDRVNQRMKHLSSEVSKVLVDHNVMITSLKNLLVEKKIITENEFQNTMTQVVTDIKNKVEDAVKKEQIQPQPTIEIQNTENKP